MFRTPPLNASADILSWARGPRFAGIFWCSKGPKLGPIPKSWQWNLGDFFPNFEKKSQSSKKIFFLEDSDFHSVNILTSYMVTFSFNLMAIVCVITFFIDQKRHNCAQ